MYFPCRTTAPDTHAMCFALDADASSQPFHSCMQPAAHRASPHLLEGFLHHSSCIRFIEVKGIKPLSAQGGREGRDIDAVELARAVQDLGAGEILLNCIDMDGRCVCWPATCCFQA